MKEPQQQDRRWSIYALALPPVFIGCVEAPDATTAVDRAVDEFDITDRQLRLRLMAVANDDGNA